MSTIPQIVKDCRASMEKGIEAAKKGGKAAPAKGGAKKAPAAGEAKKAAPKAPKGKKAAP